MDSWIYRTMYSQNHEFVEILKNKLKKNYLSMYIDLRPKGQFDYYFDLIVDQQRRK